MNHPNFEAMLRYVSDSAPEDEMIYMDFHMSECNECFEQVSALLYLKRNFSVVWENFSLEDCVQTQYQIQMTEKLLKISKAYPQFKGKVEKLLKDLRDSMTMTLKVFMDSFKKVSLVSPVPWESALSLKPDFAGIGSAGKVEIEKKLKDGIELLRKGMKDQVVTLLLEIAEKDSILVEVCRLNIEKDGREIGCVEVNSRSRTILVNCWNFDINRPPALAVLDPYNDSGKLTVSEFQYDPDYRYYFAEFREIADGIYEILIL